MRPSAACRPDVKRRMGAISKWLAALIAALPLYACQADLKAYRPQSMAEAEIRALLLQVQDAWNRRDTAAYAKLLHRHATFWLQQEMRIVDRRTYLKHLPREMQSHVQFGRPIIKLRANKAFVDFNVTSEKGLRKTTFTLLKQGRRWWILAIR